VPVLLLVRHGQASFGGGAYDVLSDTGRAQSSRLAADLERRGVVYARVVSGDMARQRDTAAAFGREVEIDPRWNEYAADDILAHHSGSDVRLEHGKPVTLTPREFQALLDEALLAWIAAGEDSPCAETWPAFAARVRGAITDGLESSTLACTSGGVIAAACVALLGAPPEALVVFNRVMVNTGVTKLVRGRGGTSLVSFNDHGHLEAPDGGNVTYR
jgi:broad specificity phosphatase PhoE